MWPVFAVFLGIDTFESNSSLSCKNFHMLRRTSVCRQQKPPSLYCTRGRNLAVRPLKYILLPSIQTVWWVQTAFFYREVHTASAMSCSIFLFLKICSNRCTAAAQYSHLPFLSLYHFLQFSIRDVCTLFTTWKIILLFFCLQGQQNLHSAEITGYKCGNLVGLYKLFALGMDVKQKRWTPAHLAPPWVFWFRFTTSATARCTSTWTT